MKKYTITLFADDDDLSFLISQIKIMLATMTTRLGLQPDHVFDAQEGNTIFVMSNPVVGAIDGHEKRNVTIEYKESEVKPIKWNDSGTVINPFPESKSNRFLFTIHHSLMPIEHPELIARIKEVKDEKRFSR